MSRIRCNLELLCPLWPQITILHQPSHTLAATPNPV
jgi:hypothetical protein